MVYTFDVQRDHAGMLADVCAVASKVVWFSTNKKKFRFEVPGFTDETRTTTPPDFRHRPHQAWRSAIGGPQARR
jgi:hypothetical protein